MHIHFILTYKYIYIYTQGPVSGEHWGRVVTSIPGPPASKVPASKRRQKSGWAAPKQQSGKSEWAAQTT